ncbi:MAG: MerR family transcriptional regulator [Fibrobacter sp.]|jgi:DNA-binding transcriptional MerR regulator|nr:MerR family transcriptional regulator [Fibrobacter sp.]
MSHQYLTSGQVAKKLKISISTLKRWLETMDLNVSEVRNCNGWRLFTEEDVQVIREHKQKLKKTGKRFNDTTLVPVIISAGKKFGAK